MPEYHFPRFNFLSIRQAADALGLPQNFVRRAQKLGKVPGFYAGNRFYVNMDMFIKKLNEDMDSFNSTTDNTFHE